MTTDITELAQLRAELSNPAVGSKDHLRKLALSLVEALEKAQAKSALVAGGIEAATKLHERIAELDAELEREREKSRRVMSRIAELESRTVKIPGWFVKDAIAVYDRDEIEEALSAAGIKWEAE